MRSNKTKPKASGSSKTFVKRKWHPQAPKKLGTINLGDYKIHSFLTTSKEYSLKEAWNSKIMNNIRDLHHSGKRNQIEPCKRCPLSA